MAATLVLKDEFDDGRSRNRRKLHNVDCSWATSPTMSENYELRDTSEFPPDQPVCGRCGGPQ